IDLTFFIFCRESIKNTFAFAVIECVVNFLAYIDTVKWRHSNKHMAISYQNWKMFYKKRTEQSCNMQAVRISVGKDANFVIAQFTQIFAARIHTDSDRNIMHFLARKNF